MPSLETSAQDSVFRITLNRPEVHNAMDPEMVVRLADAWETFRNDEALRVAILTGAGDRAFSAGADLKRLIPLTTGARQAEDEWDRRIQGDFSIASKAFLRDEPVYKPIIATINGFCLAGGTELVQVCDIRIAAAHATFALTEPKRGLIPIGGSLVRLARQIPYCHAMEILLTGEVIDADHALRIGLVNRVVPAGDLLPTAERFATIIAANGPLAVRKIKEAVLRSSGMTLPEAFQVEIECGIEVWRSEDAREGPRAFAEKRQPRFTGR